MQVKEKYTTSSTNHQSLHYYILVYNSEVNILVYNSEVVVIAL